MVSSGETKLLKTTIACDRWWTDWLLLLLNLTTPMQVEFQGLLLNVSGGLLYLLRLLRFSQLKLWPVAGLLTGFTYGASYLLWLLLKLH